MLMFRDFSQLLPVSDILLFNLDLRRRTSDNVLESNHDLNAYMLLMENITLNRIMR
jgi:hypothetical protein